MKKFIGLLFLLLVFSLFIFRTSIVGLILSTSLPPTFTYDKIEWKGSRLHLYGMHFEESGIKMHIESAELSFHPQFKPLYLELHLAVNQPEIILDKNARASSALPLVLLKPRRFCGLKLAMDQGALELRDNTQKTTYAFTFKSGEAKEEIGHFFLFDQNAPLLQVDLLLEEQGISTSLVTQKMEAMRLSQLIEGFYPPLLQGMKATNGQIEMRAGALFSKKLKVKAVNLQCAGENLALSHKDSGVEIETEKFSGKLFLPLFHESAEKLLSELIADVNVQGGKVFRTEVLGERKQLLQETAGSFLFEPGKEPSFHLQGKLNQKGKNVPFTFEGKGEMKEEGAFWTQGDFAVEGASPMHLQLSFCHPEREEYILQAEIHEMPLDGLSMLGFSLPSAIESGNMGGKITAHLHQAHLGELLLENIEIKNFVLRGAQESQGKVGLLRVEGEVSHSPHGWEFDHLTLEGSRAAFSSKTARVENAGFKFTTLGEEVQEFVLNGELDGMKSSCILQKVQEPKGELAGELLIGGEHKIELGLELLLKPFKNMQELNRVLSPGQGWLHAPTLPLSLLEKFVKGIHLQGEGDLLGTFDAKSLELTIQSERLRVEHPLASFELSQLGIKDPSLLSRDGCISLHYTFDTQEMLVDIPVVEGKIWNEKKGLKLEKLQGNCSFFVQLDAKKEEALHFKGKFFGGESALFPSSKLSNLHFDLEGSSLTHSFALSHGGGVLTLDDKVTLPFTANAMNFLYEKALAGEVDLTFFDEDVEALRLACKVQETAEGFKILLDPARAHFFKTSLGRTELLLHAGGKIARLDGLFSMNGQELPQKLAFMKKCGLLPFDPAHLSCDGSLELALRYQDTLSFEIEGKRVRWREHAFGYVKATGFKKGEEWTVDLLKLDDLQFRGRFFFNKTRVSVPMFECKTLSGRFRGEGIYEEDKKLIKANLHEITYDLSKLGGSSTFQGTVQGKGKILYDLTSRETQGETSLELNLVHPTPIHALCEKNSSFSYHPKKGLQVGVLNLFLPDRDLRVKLEKIALKDAFEKASVQKLELTSPKALLGSNVWEMQGVNFSFGSKNWEVSCATSFQKQPLFIKMEGLKSQPERMLIQVSDSQDAEGLKLQGKMGERFRWEKIAGHLKGLNVQLAQAKEKPDTLAGSVEIDLQKLAPFFPKEGKELVSLLKLGKGYELVGDFSFPKEGVPHFRGKLLGHHFECLGFIFEKLQAHAELSFDEIRLHQFSLHDRGIHGEIKLVKIDKRTKGEEWLIDVPLIKFSEVKPSLFQRVKEAKREVKPLVIKNFTLFDLRGNLKDTSTLSAHGHLNFTNLEKREQSLLDIPLQFVKDLGLDPSLLVPIYGEVELALKGQRFYVNGLKNAYSEARRAEFFLSEEKPSFIDLNGNVHVDIKLKQNVALKIIEPFTLKLRGTLDKPRLSL